MSLLGGGSAAGSGWSITGYEPAELIPAAEADGQEHIANAPARGELFYYHGSLSSGESNSMAREEARLLLRGDDIGLVCADGGQWQKALRLYWFGGKRPPAVTDLIKGKY